jgi:hypothetical protein
MVEQFTQAQRDDVVQKPKKKRSQADKIGRLKYNQFLLKRVLTEIREVRAIERIILNGLKGAGYFHFDVPMIQKLACADQVDLEIVDLVHAAGLSGIFPKDVAISLSKYNLKHYHISRRILRMNKRLEYETGERLFEKRGWKWAFTKFAFDAWNASNEEEILRETLAGEES